MTGAVGVLCHRCRKWDVTGNIGGVMPAGYRRYCRWCVTGIVGGVSQVLQVG